MPQQTFDPPRDVSDDLHQAVTVRIPEALDTVRQSHFGPAEPPSMAPGMQWFDTSVPALKLRNEANTAWLVIVDFSSE